MDTNPLQDDDAGLTAKMALCLAAITMVGIDGVFKEEESEKLRELIHADEAAFLKAFSFYNERPLDVCIKVVAAKLNDEQKQIAFKVLDELANVDKDFAVSEQDLLNQYAAEFRLSREFVDLMKTEPSGEYNLSVFD
jgi:hypothetical protein